MKVNPEQLVDRLANLAGRFSAALLFGPDQGLISETLARCVTAVAGNPADPFLIAEVTPAQLKSDEALLSDELRALPMLGTRKIIVIRQATDAIFKIVETALGITICQTFSWSRPVSFRPLKLRKAESAKSAGAVGCYADDHQKLEQLVPSDAIAGVRIEPEAVKSCCPGLETTE